MSVTFDPAARRIIEDDTGGDNELNVDDIYSLWKEWVKDGDNAKHAQAFRFVGGDPISGTQNLGSTFFLLNGWRIRPAETNHKLTLVGNLFTDPSGDSVFVPTVGSFTVNTETRVSNLVDSAVSRLDLTQLLQAVYIDTVNGTSGTLEGVGTPTNPVSNIVDAFTIADRDKLREFIFRGSITLDRNAPRWEFTGWGSEADAQIDLGGFDIPDSKFSDCEMTGDFTGFIEANNCGINLLSGLDGIFRGCGFISDFTVLAAGVRVVFSSCFAQRSQSNPIVCDVNGANDIQFHNYSGALKIVNMVAGSVVGIDLDPGYLELDASNTGGTLYVRGSGTLVDNSAGTVIEDDGLIQGEHARKVYESHFHRRVHDGGANTITIFAKDGVTPLHVFDTNSDLSEITPQ